MVVETAFATDSGSAAKVAVGLIPISLLQAVLPTRGIRLEGLLYLIARLAEDFKFFFIRPLGLAGSSNSRW